MNGTQKGKASSRKSPRQLEALVALASSLPGTTETQSILEQALDSVLEVLELHGASIYLLQGEELILTAHRGFTPEMLAEVGMMRLGQSLVGLVAETGQSLIEEDISQNKRVTTISPLKAGYRGAAIVPIQWQGKVLGVMGASSRQRRGLRAEEQIFLRAVADIVASALEHSAQDKVLKDKLNHLQVITGLTSIINSSLDIKEVYETFVHQLQQLVPVDRVALSLIEEDTAKVLSLYEHSPMGLPYTAQLRDTMIPWLIRHKHSLYNPDLSLEKKRTAWGDLLLEGGLRCTLMLPLVHLGEVFAVLILSSRQPHAFGEKERELLSELSGQVSRAVANYTLYQQVKEREQKLERAWLEVGLAWVRAYETHYPHMKGHSQRVANYVRRLCRQLGVPEQEERIIELGARLHDIGMLSIPDWILVKRGTLNTTERAQMELHPNLAVEVLAPIPQFQEALPLVHRHHEWYNGQGYPDGLRGEEIPMGARILAVADAYDAMTSTRLYRRALPSEKACQILKKGAGSQFDPQVVEAFLMLLDIAEEL